MTHRPYRITDITVVDPRDGSSVAHQDVHVVDGHIAAIRATGDTDVGADVDTVHRRTRFVVPGYNDLHAHPLNRSDPRDHLALMLAHGITGYRQMGGRPSLLRRRRSGDLDFGPQAPRLLALPGSLLLPMNSGTPEDAVAEVRRQAAEGADFVKAGLITPEVYFAAQEEADRVGIRIAGHLPAGIDVRAASKAGFHSIEHVGPGLGVLAGCSCHEAEILSAVPTGLPIKLPPVKFPFLEKLAGKISERFILNPAQSTSPAELTNLRRALDTFDEEKARELAAEFAANGTWNCPTLIRIKAQELCDAPEFRADPDLRYLTPKTRRTWEHAADRFASKFDAGQREIFAAQFAAQLRLVKIFDDEGVPLLAGSDTVGAVWVVPGASLHDEFDLLAEAGLSPLRILQTTTCDAARFLGRDDTAGTVEAGKDADLVLLDADPTAAVSNLHTVSGVVRGGVHFSAVDLATIKDELAARGVG